MQGKTCVIFRFSIGAFYKFFKIAKLLCRTRFVASLEVNVKCIGSIKVYEGMKSVLSVLCNTKTYLQATTHSTSSTVFCNTLKKKNEHHIITVNN